MGPGKVANFLNSYPAMQLKLAQLPSAVVAHWQLTSLTVHKKFSDHIQMQVSF